MNASHLSNLGLCHHSLGEYRGAIDLYTEALAIEREVLARKTGVFRKTDFGGAGTADRKPFSGQRNRFHLTIGTLDEKFLGHGRA